MNLKQALKVSGLVTGLTVGSGLAADLARYESPEMCTGDINSYTCLKDTDFNGLPDTLSTKSVKREYDLSGNVTEEVVRFVDVNPTKYFSVRSQTWKRDVAAKDLRLASKGRFDL